MRVVHAGALDSFSSYDRPENSLRSRLGRRFESQTRHPERPFLDAEDDEYSTEEGRTLSVEDREEGVLANDTSQTGLRASVVTGPSKGNLTLNADGTFEYVPAPDSNGTDQFLYAAIDNTGDTDTATVEIAIEATNDPPVVTTNDVLVVESQGDTEPITSAELRAEDPDDAASELEYAVTDGPSQGRILVDGDEESSFTQRQIEEGVVEYDHTASTGGDDQFTFDLADDEEAGPTGRTFEIMIGSDNISPTASDDDTTTSEDEVLAVDDVSNGVLANDIDPNDDPLSVSAVNGLSENVGAQITLSSGAQLTLDEDGTYTYAPNGAFKTLAAGASATDTFSYTAADGQGGDDQATVRITITGINDAPVLETVDGLGVTVGGQEDITTLDLDATDPDDAATTLEYVVTDGPSQGRILVDGDEENSFTQRQVEDGVVEYDHTTSTGVDDQFTFDLTDDEGAGPTGRVFAISVSVPNRPPTASDDDYSVTEDDTLAVTDSTRGVLGNDRDPDGDRLRASMVSPPQHGDLALNGDGTFEYVPNPDYSGSDEFVYQVSDGNGGTDQGTAALTVTAVNDPPRVAVNEGLTVDQEATQTITTSVLSASDVDDKASELEYAVTDGPSQGRILVDGDEEGRFTQRQIEEGAVEYDHTASTGADDQFTFDLTDDDGAGPTGRPFAISVRDRNSPPVARDTTVATSEDTAATGAAPGVLGNDSDPDGDALSVASVSGGGGRNIGSEITLQSGAELTVRGNGSYTYDPNGQFESLGEAETATETVPYTASDGKGATDRATVTVRIEGKNEPPTVSLTAPVKGAMVQQGEPVRLRAEAQDPDGVVQTVTFRVGDSVVGRDKDGGDGFAVDWTPTTSGPVELIAEATDELGASAQSKPVKVRVRLARVGLSVQRSFPDPTQRSSFRLVALPGQTSRSLASTLPSQSPEDWRAFRETGGTGSQTFSREECGAPDCAFRPGTGFWLTAREAWSVEDSVEAVPLEADTAEVRPVHRTSLQDGWNIVSNPLETDVPWDSVQAVSGTNQPLWRWNGRWTQAETFASAAEGRAYYFRDDALDSLTVPFVEARNAVAQTAASSGASSAPSGEDAPRPSQLSLSVEAGGDTVSTVVAGTRPNAEAGLSRMDRYGPPGYFGAASLRLIETTGDRRDALVAEYKPTGREGYAYDLRLHADPDTAVTFAADGLDAFPRARVSLVRRPTGRKHDLRADSTLTVVPREETTRFRLLIGSDAFVEEETRAVTPGETKLLPNYPNPFRQATTLEYALSEPQQVRIEIYDAMGRRVRVLVDEVQRAGFHQVRWLGRTDGRPVASGVYFARLNAETATKVERLVVLR